MASVICPSELKHEGTKRTETHEGLGEIATKDRRRPHEVAPEGRRRGGTGRFVRLRVLRGFVLRSAQTRSRLSIHAGVGLARQCLEFGIIHLTP